MTVEVQNFVIVPESLDGDGGRIYRVLSKFGHTGLGKIKCRSDYELEDDTQTYYIEGPKFAGYLTWDQVEKYFYELADQVTPNAYKNTVTET